MKDYYQILELEPNCTVDDIKQAYRRLAKKFHPDINKSPDAHQKFIEISEAYEVLLHRTSYDNHSQQQTQYDYEAFIRDVREAAQKQARMRYEKFAREHEAFRESGLYDLVLLLKYIGRVIVPLFGVGLISIPISVSYSEHSIAPMFYLFFSWVMGGFILFDAFLKRKGYFKLGTFYYSRQKILQFYKTKNPAATEECFYCKGLKADSYPYKINFIRLKNIRLKNLGPLQHYAGYERNEFNHAIPRSRKAFIVHTIASLAKIISILLAVLFIPLESYVWRFIGGAIMGWFLATLVLLISQTKSKTGYLFSYGMIIKIAVWVVVLVLFSRFRFSPFQISPTDYLKSCLVIMTFLDSFIEQLLKISKKPYLFEPISKHYKNVGPFFDGKYLLYLEVPLWTTVYPIVRWIF
jgi:hypothetical protein